MQLRKRAVLAVWLCSMGALAQELALPLPDAKAPQKDSSAPRWLHKGSNGTLQLTCSVKGALVSIDGLEVGTTPLPALPMAPGQHPIRVTADGFMPFEKTVSLKAGQKLKLAADLMPLLPLAPPELAKQVPEEPSPADTLTALIAAPPPAPLLAEAPPLVLAPPEAPPLVLANGELANNGLRKTTAVPAGAQKPVAAPVAAVAAAPAQGTPLVKQWWFWGGAAVATAVVIAAVTYALPASYVEQRDPAAACHGTCGVVVNR